MNNYFVSMYQILKAIEISSYTNSFKYDKTLDLEKLKLTETELDIIIKNIVEDELVKGISVFSGLSGYKAVNPHLTTKGYDFLENNSNMKKAYRIAKEIRAWIPIPSLG